ncbi:MAG: PRC-barrel domain-containing protein [Solirubrobacterales bacterium]
MQDLGEPISYLTVSRGIPVYSSDGERLGRVVRVLSAPEANMFDGVVFDTTSGPGGHRFVDAPEVGQIFEGGIVLEIDAAEAAALPKPRANPGTLSVKPGDLGPGGRGGFLRRAWDSLSGKR